VSAGWIGLLLGCWLVFAFLLACVVGSAIGRLGGSDEPPRPAETLAPAREQIIAREVWSAEDDRLRARDERVRSS
jgi:hypothetical protein